MRLDLTDVPVVQDFDSFMLVRPNDREWVLQALVEGAWANQYGFDLSPQEWVDFTPANYMNSTHPEGLFVQKLVIVLHHAEGRSILVGDTLKTVHQGRVTKQTVAGAVRAALVRERFGLPLPG
jgi:N-hydroxyarylamine O-acetyltransferase